MAREPAWRVFAAEYNASKHFIKAEEKKKPSYVITPIGAKISRLFIVGVLTEVRVINDEVITARVADQSGAFYLFVGKFRPRARQVLESTPVPQFVAVVGKTNVYRPRDDLTYVSVVPEYIKVVDEVLRDYWVLDTAKKLRAKIDAMKEALNMEHPSIENLINLGFSEKISEGVITAITQYDKINVEIYEDILKNALKHLLPEYQEMGYELPSVNDDKSNEIEDAELESKILDIIDKLDDGGGAIYSDILDESGIEGPLLDQILDNLRERGEIYEPYIGKIKRV